MQLRGWSHGIVMWSLAVIACRSPPRAEPPPESPPTRSPPAAGDDYAIARTRFHTHLVRHGPPPQPWEPVVVAADARELPYDSGELHLTAWISATAVDGTAKRPAVLFLHGGFAFDLDDWEMSRPFRDAGYVVMTPLVRGENGQPGEFSVFYDELDDVLAAADALARQPGVDAGHLYVAGHSVGGTLTLLAALASPRFRAAASLSGAPDHRAWMTPQSDLMSYDLQNDEEIRMRSPLAFAASFKCPTRLYWGNREQWATEMTEKTARLAKAAGLDVDATQVAGNHRSMVTPAIELAIAFFQQHR